MMQMRRTVNITSVQRENDTYLLLPSTITIRLRSYVPGESTLLPMLIAHWSASVMLITAAYIDPLKKVFFDEGTEGRAHLNLGAV